MTPLLPSVVPIKTGLANGLAGSTAEIAGIDIGLAALDDPGRLKGAVGRRMNDLSGFADTGQTGGGMMDRAQLEHARVEEDVKSCGRRVEMVNIVSGLDPYSFD